MPCFFMFRDERYDHYVLRRIEQSRKTVAPPPPSNTSEDAETPIKTAKAPPEYLQKLDQIAAKYTIENESSSVARKKLLENVREMAKSDKVKLYEDYPHPHDGIKELSVALKVLANPFLRTFQTTHINSFMKRRSSLTV